MTRLIIVFFALLLSACTSEEALDRVQDPINASSANPARVLTLSGPQTAQDLTERYNNETRDCLPSTPGIAFECSGVLLRGTNHSTQYHAWNPNPSPSTTGLSFSYLRRDSKFQSMYIYKNGFIFYSKRSTPADKINIDILCFFPRDGATNIREDQGCGRSPDVPTSQECQALGINKAEQWVAHYKQYGSYGDMCGLNVREVLGERAVTAFNEGLKAQRLIFEESFLDYNELRIAKWEQNIGNVLPIQAFFYFDDTGKAGAQYDQKDFLSQTGISLPIIFIRMPVTPLDQATFTFIAADQAIPLDDHKG